MPFTFFAHQAVVIPIKWARPRWFDGTALCIGSMAPDLSYALDGTRWEFASHRLPAQLWFCLPLTVILTQTFRRAIALPLGRDLPGAVGAELVALASGRWPMLVTAMSALIGSMSHIALDGFTHAHGWATDWFPALASPVHVGGTELPWATLLQYLGHSVGSAAALAMMIAMVRSHRISQWHGIAPTRAQTPNARRTAQRLAVATVVAAIGVASALATHAGLPAAIMRGALGAGLGLLAALAVERRVAH